MPVELWAAIGKASVVVAALVVLRVLWRPGDRVMDWLERAHRRPW